MDAGAKHADRRDAGDATILRLDVDDEPAFGPAGWLTRHTPAARRVAVRCRGLVRWAWLTPLLILVVCGL